MNLGNTIQKLRKKNNLSQEQLAEIIGVTRQTISKWELAETSPDLNQAKKLSETFKVSLDDLTNNNIKDILITKANDTEKLIKITIIFMKMLVVLIIMAIIGIIALFTYFNIQVVDAEIITKCKRAGSEYSYNILVNDKAKKDINDMKIINFNTNDKEFNQYINIKEYKTAQQLLDYIKEYNVSNNGVCE